MESYYSFYDMLATPCGFPKGDLSGMLLCPTQLDSVMCDRGVSRLWLQSGWERYDQ